MGIACTSTSGRLQSGHRGEAVVDALRQMCRDVHGSKARPAAMATGLPPLDAALPRGGLDRGAVHEWIGTGDPVIESSSSPEQDRSAPWWPPLAMLVHLGCRAIAAAGGSQNHLVWVGRAVWPYVSALSSSHGGEGSRALARSLFVRAEHPAERVWAADLALRSGAAAAVIADGSGMDMAATRRLQLAGEAGGSLCLLARPPWERTHLSAAATRWCVRFCPSSAFTRRWTVELLRCKGMQPAAEGAGAAHSGSASGSASGGLWILERHHATRTVVVVPGLLHRSDSDSAKAPAAAVRLTA